MPWNLLQRQQRSRSLAEIIRDEEIWFYKQNPRDLHPAYIILCILYNSLIFKLLPLENALKPSSIKRAATAEVASPLIAIFNLFIATSGL